MKQNPELSRAELDILTVLWKHKAQTVREVHDALVKKTNWAYSTTKTMMDRMVKKNLLIREEYHRIFIYRPLVTRVQGLVKWVKYFAENILETDPEQVVALFGKANTLTDQEIDQLKNLLNEDENDR